MRLFITGLLLLVVNYAYAQIPTYYNDVDVTLTGTALQNALTNKITATHTNFLSYTPGVWEALMVTDEDPLNSSNVLLIYGYNDSDGNYVTDRSRSKTANGGTAGTDWNREHTYVKSLGTPNLGTSGPGADAHHLRPSDVTMNSDRGSLKFIDGSGNAGVTGSGWYPGDEWKGDVARMMMYMYLRYGSRCLPSNVAIGTTNSIDSNMIDLFLEWNAEDPVSDFERQRNTYHENTSNTYAQGNRNPFIDNPIFATNIWGGPTAEDFFSGSAAGCSELFISEYIEGSSNNKYIEIYNPTNASVNLSTYDLVIYANGSSSISNTLTLSGTITAYGTFVIENSSEALGVTADLSTSNAVMTFNGDDTIALRNASVAIDIIGQIGTDPGTQWTGTVCIGGTADGVLRRNIAINTGDSDGTDIFDPDTEWTCASTDDVSNLGAYTNNCVPNPEINIQGNGSSISDGSTTTQLSDFTEFGSVAASSGTIIRTFTIENTGTSTLTISGNPTLSGAGAGDFTVSTNPSLSIGASGSTTFQITFDPSAEATSTATVTINSDDADEATYTFDISGTGIAGGGGSSCGSDLFISEYIEGSGNNKYIEIYNPTDASIDLSSYDLVSYTNGSASVSNTLTLSGTIAASSTYVIENSSEALGVTADLSTTNAVMQFNGDDAIALRKSSVAIDVIGQIGTDPGSEWAGTTCTTGTANGVIRRNAAISTGDSDGSDAFDPDTEWTCAASDTVSDLGSHTVDCGGGSSSSCGDDLFISEYIEGSGNNKYIEIYNPTDASIDLSSYDLVSYTNGSASVSNTLTLSGTIAASSTYVIENSSEALGVTADLSTTNAVMQFNGDDAIALRKSSVAIDVIGQIGTDPGSEWAGTTCTTGTANGVIRRNAAISTGDSDGSDAFDPDTEWTCAASNTVSDLGLHTVDCDSGSSGGSGCDDLFISEYIEGSGNNKYIEIYNPTNASVNLSSYDLVSYTNGSATISNTLTLSGSISAYGTFVIENSSEDQGVTADLSTTNGVMQFNGDDAIALRKSSVAIDVIGQIGTDPGSQWSGAVCTLGTADATLQRNTTVNSGDSDGSDAFDPDTEWTCAVFDVSDLGSYTNDCSSSVSVACSELFISEYIEGTGDNKYIEIYNPSDSSIDLSSYDLVRYTNGSATVSNTLTLSGSVAPKGTFIIENSLEALSVDADLSTSDGTMSFNGDDAIALRKSSVIIDVIGQIGTDPGTEWAGATCTQGTADGGLRRNATVDQGDTDGSDAFDPDTEWTCVTVDDVSNLGSYTNNCDSSSGAPEIDVFGNSISIIDAASSTSTNNNTNFGTVSVAAGSVSKEYTITNNGTGILTLTSNPTITGSSDFSVTTNPASLTLNPTESVTFQITFDPSSDGSINGTVEILSDDTDEASFTFAISGNGTSSAANCSIESGATLFQQDFESSPSSPVYTYASTNTSTATGNGNTPSDPKYVSGTQGIQVNNGTGEIEFETVDVSESSNIEFSVRLASFSTTSGNGAEATDYVKVFVSTDSGSNYSEELTVTGASANNARWSFTSGTGEASTTYDGDNTTTTFAPAGSGARTTDGYSTLTVTGLPTSSTLRIKLEIRNNSSGEIWVLDDAKLIGDSEASSTWESGSWSNGVPSTTTKTIINGYYDMTANQSINTCECEVMPGATITIGIDQYLRVENNIVNNGTIIVEENGSLVQVSSSSTITGSGNYIVRRNSSIVSSYNVYTYWSSPLESSTLNEVAPNGDLYYSFNGASQSWVWANQSTTMTPGVGYIAQGPVDAIYPGIYTAVFTGSKFNTGNVNVTLGFTSDADTDNDWNLLGNPYPSAIDANAFISANPNIGGTLYFWSNNTEASSSSDFSQDDYVSWNGTGGIAGCSGCIEPTGAIAAGQGFFAQALSATDVTFTNEIRDMANNNNFYRSSSEEDKIWLNFSGDNAFSQTLIGFLPKATDGEDRLYDGAKLDGGANASFYSLIDGSPFGIQGKSNLKEVEEIPLGVKLSVTGDFKISIEKFEGLLNDSEIYLKDLLLDIEHDLKVSDYEFSLSDNGTYDDRFVLKIVTSADVLNIENIDNEHDLIIIDLGNELEVKTLNGEVIKDVYMYDILGRNLITKRKSMTSSVYVLGKNIKKNTITLVKVLLESGKVKTMKFFRK
ncbi:MAG: lamin tail domain-containing protein [Flavobacteriaceae bacterium]